MDKEFFVREIELRQDMLYRIAYAILQNDDACADALQDAILKAWEKRNTLREEQYFRTWLTRILINTCRRARMKQRRFLSIEEVPEPSAQPPDPTLALLLSQMPEQLRLPLLLQSCEGMTYAEISQVLQLPESTVRGRIHRAKLYMRKELEA
ncbi:MAG: RNA polymerase sigma factor [Clostridia bacterium]|nr:RNA polymerase sigma factor [Clostridia bacterium]